MNCNVNPPTLIRLDCNQIRSVMGRDKGQVDQYISGCAVLSIILLRDADKNPHFKLLLNQASEFRLFNIKLKKSVPLKTFGNYQSSSFSNFLRVL